MKHFVQHTLFPILAAVIWGTAFSAQSVCSRYLPAFAVNAFRGLLSFAVLSLACVLLHIKAGNRKDLIRASLLCGTALFLATNAQQFGIGETSAGKSGFITALYIVLVPLFSTVFLKKRISGRIWVAVVIAVAGLFFLCVSGDFSVGIADLALLFCAVMFAVQILGVDSFSEKIHPVALSAGQFLINGLLSLICSLVFESVSIQAFSFCIWQLLYVALFSSCVAYTLQIFAQKGGNATIVTLLLSLESVFALLGGMVLLGEKLSGRELFGCLLMTAAIILAQLPEKSAVHAES
ncbi:MAG: DMT family transporter [Eubacteriales bacterium]|nr:DMT family transporter [Eubacteriales bacterium]